MGCMHLVSCVKSTFSTTRLVLVMQHRRCRRPGFQLLLFARKCIHLQFHSVDHYWAVLVLAYAPFLLERKAEKIKKSMGADSPIKDVRTVFQSDGGQWVLVLDAWYASWTSFLTFLLWSVHSGRHILGKAVTRPFALLFQAPIVQLLGVYMAFVYGLFFSR